MTLVATTAVAVAVTRGRGTALGSTTAVGTAGTSPAPCWANAPSRSSAGGGPCSPKRR